jgi:hypothetical protein
MGKPPSSRTRYVAPRKASRSLRSKRRRIPCAPRVAGAVPGRSTAATAYCAGSSLKLTVATIGR